jgi:hypothetical protein
VALGSVALDVLLRFLQGRHKESLKICHFNSPKCKKRIGNPSEDVPWATHETGGFVAYL